MAKFSHPCPNVAELESLAKRPTLDAWEMADLIQGFCPRRRLKQFRTVSWLDTYEVEIGIMRNAISTKELASRASPVDFVRWAVLRDIPLPEQFVDAVRAQEFVLRRSVRPMRFNEELVRTVPTQGARPSVPKLRGYDSKLCQRAREIVLAYVSNHGTLPPKGWVDKQLAETTGLPLNTVARGYALGMVLTQRQFDRAKRAYRRRFHQEREIKAADH
ncbi:MAG: hypothetical protein KF853_13625 [Rhodocyclaceae bacterium]|nr:hypothetical protein [Rhodocyclaceae bacterium]MBX3678052.1 hypothetical protein [Rhodocyclaceae bacterium]